MAVGDDSGKRPNVKLASPSGKTGDDRRGQERTMEEDSVAGKRTNVLIASHPIAGKRTTMILASPSGLPLRPS